MYNYFINFQRLLLDAPLPLGARSTRLVRLWVNPALISVEHRFVTDRWTDRQTDATANTRAN